MMKPPFSTQILLTACFLTTGISLAPANAGVLLDNTNGGTAPAHTSYITSLTNSTSSLKKAIVFTAKQDLTLTSLTVMLSHNYNTDGYIALYELASTSTAPGTPIASISTGILPANGGAYYTTLSLNALPMLDAGGVYALSLERFTVGSGSNVVNWYSTDPAAAPQDTTAIDFDQYRLYSNDSWGSNSTTYNSFYLQGTPSGASVPEPSSIALAVIGAGSFATRRLLARRRK